MKVAITGSHGLIGSALAAHLEGKGHAIVRLVRTAAGPGEVSWDPTTGALDARQLEGIDAIVHLAGAGIGDKRWSPERKAQVLDSRTQGTRLIARTAAGLSPVPTLLSGSAIGYYGDRGPEELTESSEPGRGFLADVCVQWEAATAPAQDAGGRVIHLRTGIVLTPAGGALKKQLPLFRAGIGGKLGSGHQYLSWISLADELAAIAFALEDASVHGPLNLTAPHPVTNAAFTRALGRALHRPAIMPVPTVALKVLMGTEMVTEMLLGGANVVPRGLERAGYRFEHPILDEALRCLLAP